jgi:LysM repeat protein
VLFDKMRSKVLEGVALLLVLCLATTAAISAPTEEDIGASSPSHTARPTPRLSDTPKAVYLPKSFPAPAISDLPSYAPTVSQPRASFPYTIRPGDTLGSIAALFGVAVVDIRRLNRLGDDAELIAGQALRIQNPFLARERLLTNEIDRLSSEKRTADERAAKLALGLSVARAQVQDLTTSDARHVRDLRTLPWWRAFGMAAATAAVLLFGAMALALSEWWILRNRFRAAAEMNDSLRRLDYKYRTALAKAELRLQELYGRRRRGLDDGQDRPRISEEAEIEELSRQLKEVLEHHLMRLGPPGRMAGKARWRERISGIGSPIEARSARR